MWQLTFNNRTGTECNCACMQQNSERRDHVWEDKLSSTLQGQWKSPISWYLCVHWLVVGVIHIDVSLFATAKRVGCEEPCFTCPTRVQELCTSPIWSPKAVEWWKSTKSRCCCREGGGKPMHIVAPLFLQEQWHQTDIRLITSLTCWKIH